MPIDSLNWREPILAFDAATALPADVDFTPSRLTSFGAAAVSLLNDLTSGPLSTTELSARLRRLANLAHAHSLSFSTQSTGAKESARASRRSSSGLRPTEIEERIRYDDFFGIRRVERLRPEPLANTIFVSLAHTLHDLADAQIGIHELIALLRGAVGATAWIGDSDTQSVDDFRPVACLDPLARFRLGHVIFAVACNFATHHIRSAIQESGEIESGRLTAAAVFVRASTAAMWYSVAFPRQAYSDVVRPLMDAASTQDHGFSGLDNFDFRRMRESWEELASTLAARIQESSAEVRDAAHQLFETIVEDNEHHVLIAAAMVGILPSLKYERMVFTPGVRGIPAVSALRLNADERRQLLEKIFGE